jgi:hypothetical protein
VPIGSKIAISTGSFLPATAAEQERIVFSHLTLA